MLLIIFELIQISYMKNINTAMFSDTKNIFSYQYSIIFIDKTFHTLMLSYHSLLCFCD